MASGITTVQVVGHRLGSRPVDRVMLALTRIEALGMTARAGPGIGHVVFPDHRRLAAAVPRMAAGARRNRLVQFEAGFFVCQVLVQAHRRNPVGGMVTGAALQAGSHMRHRHRCLGFSACHVTAVALRGIGKLAVIDLDVCRPAGRRFMAYRTIVRAGDMASALFALRKLSHVTRLAGARYLAMIGHRDRLSPATWCRRVAVLAGRTAGHMGGRLTVTTGTARSQCIVIGRLATGPGPGREILGIGMTAVTGRSSRHVARLVRLGHPLLRTEDLSRMAALATAADIGMIHRRIADPGPAGAAVAGFTGVGAGQMPISCIGLRLSAGRTIVAGSVTAADYVGVIEPGALPTRRRTVALCTEVAGLRMIGRLAAGGTAIVAAHAIGAGIGMVETCWFPGTGAVA